MQENKSHKSIVRIALSAIFAILILMNFACETSSSPQKNSNQTNASPEVKLTDVERDIKSLQTANFDYIFVIRRKDGGVLDREDQAYIKANTPADTNRFYLSDEDKAVVAGSSYEFKPENLEKLGERFNIENYSSAKKVENDNVNQSTDNKNVNKTVGNK